MLKRLHCHPYLYTHLTIVQKMCERAYGTAATTTTTTTTTNILLKNAQNYQPDTLDLNTDTKAAAYWFPLFRDMITKFSRQAAASQRDQDSTADERAEQFRLSYIAKLEEYESQANNPDTKTVLGIRTLLELNELELRCHGFTDPWLSQKTNENDAAIDLLKARLNEIDAITECDERWAELVRGVLAGNMFDWGAEAVATILVNDENFGLHAAKERIEKRPWLIDCLDGWLARLKSSKPHKCAVVFVDNSGVDIVLGILPFVRELLKRGTKVILCANEEPTLNDVTTSELYGILQRCRYHCTVLDTALSRKSLLIYSNGQKGPCLDMRTLPAELCEAIKQNETDLLVIEGMGRALHTNLYAKFNCETLKLAVVKNKWLAERLGGNVFAVICSYEQS